jgi:hypothetical protein
MEGPSSSMIFHGEVQMAGSMMATGDQYIHQQKVVFGDTPSGLQAAREFMKESERVCIVEEKLVRLWRNHDELKDVVAQELQKKGDARPTVKVGSVESDYTSLYGNVYYGVTPGPGQPMPHAATKDLPNVEINKVGGKVFSITGAVIRK